MQNITDWLLNDIHADKELPKIFSKNKYCRFSLYESSEINYANLFINNEHDLELPQKNIISKENAKNGKKFSWIGFLLSNQESKQFKLITLENASVVKISNSFTVINIMVYFETSTEWSKKHYVVI